MDLFQNLKVPCMYEIFIQYLYVFEGDLMQSNDVSGNFG